MQKNCKEIMYSADEEMEHSSLLLECRLCTVTSFQNVQYGKGEKASLHSDTPDKHYLSRWSGSTPRDQSCWQDISWHVMRMKIYFFDPPPKSTYSQYNHKKNNRQILTEGHSTKYLTSAPQNLLSKTSKDWRTVTAKRSLMR